MTKLLPWQEHFLAHKLLSPFKNLRLLLFGYRYARPSLITHAYRSARRRCNLETR
jgi:hypothetical protein